MSTRDLYSPMAPTDLSPIDVPTRVRMSYSTESGSGRSAIAEHIISSVFLCEREHALTSDGLIKHLAATISEHAIGSNYVDAKFRQSLEVDLCNLLGQQAAAFSSPIWMNWEAGNNRPTSSCYILDVSDSLDSLFDALRCQVQIFRAGGGCGQNMSALRSSHETLSTGVRAPGPLEFIHAIAPISQVLRSGGRERSSSNIFLLDVQHPDIEPFIRIDGSLPANCIRSVRATDAFMQEALSANESPWPTVTITDGRTISSLSARNLLETIAAQMLRTGEPGIQFVDTINAWHTCPSTGMIEGSNPCGEFLFLNDTAATLASLNLLRFFRGIADYSIEALAHAVDLLALSLDIILGKSEFPSADIQKNTLAYRPILIGYSNFATTLMALGVPYDSDDGRRFCSLVSSFITGRAYRQSALAASRLGAFSEFAANRGPMLEVIERHRSAIAAVSTQAEGSSLLEPLFQQLHAAAKVQWEDALQVGRRWGFRNAQVTAIAPTGTTSLVMDCDSTGIEPRLALFEEKRLRNGTVLRTSLSALPRILQGLREPDGSRSYNESRIASVLEAFSRDVPHDAPLRAHHRDVFSFAFNSEPAMAVSPDAHVRMVAAAAPHISGGISKTVLLAGSSETFAQDVQTVSRLLVQAWKSGVKGLTIYRVGSRPDEPVRKGTHDGESAGLTTER